MGMRLFIQVLDQNILETYLEEKQKVNLKMRQKIRSFTQVLDLDILGTDSETELKIKMAQIIKQVKNLYKLLIKDKNSVFYAADCINKKLINRSKTSFYDNDKVFVKLYKESENIKKIYNDENNQPNLTLATPFTEKKRDTDCLTLYSFKGLFKLLHADTADLIFLAKSTVNPKYYLLVVNLFTSKIYIYPMKKKHFFKKKLELSYEDISKKRKPNQEIRLQTDQEFQRNKIKRLNASNNITMFSTKTRTAKEKKIREVIKSS